MLVIGAETLSRITDYTDRASCILFGDGAGAVVLQRGEDKRRILWDNPARCYGIEARVTAGARAHCWEISAPLTFSLVSRGAQLGFRTGL